MNRQRRQAAHLQLELTMRDVLEGMEELVSMDRDAFPSGCFEILGIEPERYGTAGPVQVLPFPHRLR